MVLETILSDNCSSTKELICCTSHFINEEHNIKHIRLSHCHNNYSELFFVCKGEGKYIVDSMVYDVTEGDIVICNAGILHGENLESWHHVRSYSIGITNFVIRGLPQNWICPLDTIPVVSSGHLAQSIKEIFRLIYKLTDCGSRTNTACNSLAKGLLLITRQLIDERCAGSVPRNYSPSHAAAERIRLYLNDHSHEALTLSDIAGALKLNKYYLSHVFKAEYGISPIQYAMERRLGEAQGYLMDSDMPIGDIADMLGFSSTSHFNSMFNKYVGISPGKYRESIKNMEE